MASERVREQADTTAYLNAGGRGTRLNSLFPPDAEYGVAKALLEVGTPPLRLVDHHIAMMARSAFRNIVIGAGDLVPVDRHVRRHYDDDDMVESVLLHDMPQLGTAGDLIHTVRQRPELFGDHVLIKNVDTILDIDDDAFADFHRSHLGALSIALTTQTGVPNEGAFLLDDTSRILHSLEATDNARSRETAARLATGQGSSTGALVISTDFLRDYDWAPAKGQLSLYRDVMGRALLDDQAYGHIIGSGFFVDIGTEATWRAYAQSDILQKYLCYDTNTKAKEEAA
jgi:NDP-sugar pyrophosphorylase family protein